MDRRSRAAMPLISIVVIALLLPVSVLAKGQPPDKGPGGEEAAGNNLSFPAIAVDAFPITPLATESFEEPYSGEYPGLTPEEIADLQSSGPWYPQQTEGNVWQADYEIAQDTVDVSFVDWGDNIESVDPTVRRPFRLEVVLFKTLDSAMTGHLMAVLENPSSSTELQGTNKTEYDSLSATVISAEPGLVIQALGKTDPAKLTWNASLSCWTVIDETDPECLDVTPVGFGPELNVGGKYIYGASGGGWKPTVAGDYRITFFVPAGSNVNLGSAEILTPAPETVATLAADEGGGATPVIVADQNLTYVDVYVKPRR